MKLLLILLGLLSWGTAMADVVWFDGTNPVSYQVVGKADPVVQIALRIPSVSAGSLPAAARKRPRFLIPTSMRRKQKSKRFGRTVDTVLPFGIRRRTWNISD